MFEMKNNESKNVGIISLGSGGTMGHMSLTTNLANSFKKKGLNIFLFSEHNYSEFTNKKNINLIRILKQKHFKTVGGCLEYSHKRDLMNKIIKSNIKTIIFSTFYDLDILNFAHKNKIKTILVSYPLRNSHRQAIKIKKYYNYFDKIFTLDDITNTKKLFPNEKIVSYFVTKTKTKKNVKKIKNILVTCGGGGRPSANLFWKKIKAIVKYFNKNNPEISFTLIKGNSKFEIDSPNSKTIFWSQDFSKILMNNDLIISEAGYFTLIDLISLKKFGIIIPGERRIDNQELRGLKYESNKLGFCFLPVKNSKLIISKISELINNPKMISELKINNQNYSKELFKKIRIDEEILKEVLK